MVKLPCMKGQGRNLMTAVLQGYCGESLFSRACIKWLSPKVVGGQEPSFANPTCVICYSLIGQSGSHGSSMGGDYSRGGDRAYWGHFPLKSDLPSIAC